MRHAAPVRAEIGVPTVFNVLGPLAHPGHVRRQVIGVSDPAMAERMVRVLAATGSVHAMAVSGDGSLDELATTGPSIVHELRDGEIRRYEVTPESVGLDRTTTDQLAGGDAAANVAKARQVLGGEAGPVRDIVVLNAAAGLVVAGVAGDLAAGVDAAQASIDTGAAAASLDRLLAVARGVLMRLGIAGVLRSVEEQVRLATIAERTGFDLVGIGDTQIILPEAFVTLTAMAAATERITLATTVANPITRHVSVAAAGMSALQVFSGGRVVYGVGTGDSAVANIGFAHSRLGALERHCRHVQQLARGDEVTIDGHQVRLQWQTRAVPVYVAAGGPKTMRRAAQFADGIICGNGISPEVVQSNLVHIAEDTRRRTIAGRHRRLVHGQDRRG